MIPTLAAPPSKETEVSFCLDFCPSRYGGEQLVVGAMDKVQVYRRGRDAARLRPAEELKGHRGLVRDVSWAAGMGRSHHLIATGCKDGHVRIFKLTAAQRTSLKSKYSNNTTSAARPGGKPRAGTATPGLGGSDEMLPSDATNPPDEEAGGPGEHWVVELVADFDDHHSDVWRVSWNATGTVLSSAGDDGTIRLWKAAFPGEFKCLSVISSQRSGYVGFAEGF